MFIFDAHSDIWLKCNSERRKGNTGYFENTHIPKLIDGKIGGGIFVVYTDTEQEIQPQKLLWQEIGGMCREIEYIEENLKNFIIVKNYGDIVKAVNEGKFFIILGAEGLSGINGDIDQISTLFRLGIRHASLTWNEKNELAAGAGWSDSESGVTELGEKAIKHMESLGMILDVSHLNEKSFWDVVRISSKPIIASHSNSKALCNHRRNITDEQAKAIAQTGGVIGVNVCGVFISENKPSLKKYVDHIEHFIKVAGIEHVGIGFDFCDFLRDTSIDDDVYFETQTTDLDTISKAGNVILALRDRGYKDSEINKITHGNFMRVIKEIIE